MQRALDAIMRGDVDPISTFEHRILTAKGEWVWAEGSPRVLRGPDGRPTGMVTQLRDITARRAAQVALAESEARYRLLADLATDIIVRMDADGVIRYISPSCRRLGYEAEEMIGKSAYEFLHPEDHELAQVRAEALFKGEPRPAGEGREYRARTKDGGFLWLEGMSALSHNEAGELVDVVSQLRDVTERRTFEDELRRKRAEAEAATLAKSEFLANMSHEIRTPLTGIMGFAGLLEEQADLSPEARTYVSRIATGSRTLLTVVNDILDFSKIEAGQVELDAQAFDPARFVLETVELVSAQAEEKGLELCTAIDGHLPPAVSADGARLRQVLLNLLTNAIKFTEAGDVTVTLGHEAADGGRLRIAVTDTGVGIAPERLHRLFQRFSQADGSISRQYGGTGLGLAICRSLATLMGGETGVESIEGKGSRFWFTVGAPACEPPHPRGWGQRRRVRRHAGSDTDRRRLAGESRVGHRAAQRVRARYQRGDRRRRSRSGRGADPVRPDPDGPADAGHGRPGRHAGDPHRRVGQPRDPDRGAQRQHPAQSSRSVPAGRHERSHRQTDRHA